MKFQSFVNFPKEIKEIIKMFLHFWFFISLYKFFDIEVIYLQILFFEVLVNGSTATDFPSLCFA